jgi:hypothetical protein
MLIPEIVLPQTTPVIAVGKEVVAIYVYLQYFQ